MNAVRHHTILGLALGIGIGLLTVPAARAADTASTEDKLFTGKCSLCHTSKRVHTMDPAQIKPVLERMRKMNPDWLTTSDSDHIAGVLAKIVADPGIIAGRQAWREAVDRGEQLFQDGNLGKNAKACTDCHATETMKQVADGFPRYDLKLRRLVTLDEIVSLMVREQLGGELAPNSPQLHDLLAYLKSLK